MTYSSLNSIVFQSACTGQAVPVSPLGSPCQGWSQPGAHSPCPPVLGQLWAEGSARGGTRYCSTCRPCPPSPYSWASHPTQPGLSEGNGWTAGLSSVVLQTQVVHDPKAIMVERDLLPGSRIPIPRLPAIFIPTQLTANAGGFLGLRCSTQQSAVLPRSLLAVGFISLCYGPGQLQMVWATLRQSTEGRNDWSLFEEVMSSDCTSMVLLRETHASMLSLISKHPIVIFWVLNIWNCWALLIKVVGLKWLQHLLAIIKIKWNS